MKNMLVVALSIVVLASFSWAATVESCDFTCPICGTPFTAECQPSYEPETELIQLDSKPLSPFMVVPDILPVCPDCHFPQIQRQQTLSQAWIDMVRPYIESEEYQQLAKDNAPYFLLAKINEQVGELPDYIGLLYLRASWQVDGTQPYYGQARPDKYREYAELTIWWLHQAAVDWYAHYDMLCADLERKMGLFEPAQERLYEVDSLEEINRSRVKILALELQLIEAGDTAPHFLSEAENDSLRWIELKPLD